MNNANTYWDNIHEYEVDSSWKNYPPEGYREYRNNFELAKNRIYDSPFPISFEIEGSYHCNLKCPFCARVINVSERESKHMSEDLWSKILKESQENNLRSILLDHEAESLMNPRIFEMIESAKNAGIIDIWLHTNANMLTQEFSEKLIDCGLTKINFSIDAFSEETYKVLRVGGDYEKVLDNIDNFLKLKLKKNAHFLRVRISFVSQKENEHEKKPFFDYWKAKKGVNIIAFQKYIDFSPFEKPDEDWDLSEKELERKYESAFPFHCSQPWENNVIDVDGNYMPCGQPVRDHTKNFVLGNLNSGDTIKSCWNGPKMEVLKELHQKGEWYKNPMCRICVKTLPETKDIVRQSKSNKD